MSSYDSLVNVTMLERKSWLPLGYPRELYHMVSVVDAVTSSNALYWPYFSLNLGKAEICSEWYKVSR